MAIRKRVLTAASRSERTILLEVVLLASAVSAVVGFVLSQYYSVDVLSSLVAVPQDCVLDWGMKVGRHCFSDYALTTNLGAHPNPWEPYEATFSGHSSHLPGTNYLPANTLPHITFGLLGHWLHAPRLGLLGYMLALTIAFLTPAVWAARGARGLERIVVFVTCSIAATPAWMVIDRGNSACFVVPIALVFLVALCQQRWRLAVIMVILAALVKPQFAVLPFALFAARQWRWGGLAVAGVAISNIAAYLLWPRDFPKTIPQSIHNVLDYGSPESRTDIYNVSFAKGLLWIPDAIKAQGPGGIPTGFLAGPRSLIGYVVLLLVVVAVVALGRRIPPIMVGIVLLATVSLFPAVSSRYYLVFVLPIAALLARDPSGPPGSGIFDRLETLGDRRRAVGICVSLAAALTIAQIPLPSPSTYAPISGQMGAGGVVGATLVVATTVALAPVLWLVVCAAILVSYARKPAPSPRGGRSPDREGPQHTAATSSTPIAVPTT
jgi:hypothetical protein